MSAERVLVVSDAHLGGVPEAVEAAFHGFLDQVPQAGEQAVDTHFAALDPRAHARVRLV